MAEIYEQSQEYYEKSKILIIKGVPKEERLKLVADKKVSVEDVKNIVGKDEEVVFVLDGKDCTTNKLKKLADDYVVKSQESSGSKKVEPYVTIGGEAYEKSLNKPKKVKRDANKQRKSKP